MERKQLDGLKAKISLSDDGSGSFVGYGSTFGNRDRAGEIVTPGAFAKGLERFLRDGFVAVGHDWQGLPVATVKAAGEDEYGLRIEAEFHSTAAAQDARRTVQERIARGKSVGLSIGYRVTEAEDTEDGRLLKEIELHEVSLVTVPCNPLAQVAGAKSEGDGSAGRTLAEHAETVLAAVEASAQDAKTLVSRCEEVNELRAKEGRMLSTATREKVARLAGLAREIADDCDALLAVSEPKPKADREAERLRAAALSALAEYERTRARLSGVAV